MEVERDPLYRPLIIDSWCSADLSAYLGSSTGVALHYSNPLNSHPLSLLH